ncbi:metallophosphoesterase family protein [Bacillus sp. Bva_UNVM-123]|uniref:metallophosphoesterase family protein n=1 Tax=Bacillus sp. Bva_UNVM-123 TaxID=2829798 RepID=UPI00391EFA2D
MTTIDRILVISDIHGCYDEFDKLLHTVKYSSATDQLILLGDYIDRGKDNKKVVEIVRELEGYGAIALRGNHDQMFLDFVKRPHVYSNVYNYLRNGGEITLRNYINDFDSYQWHDETYRKWAEEIVLQHGDDIGFIDSLPYYYETEEYIFTHAGINPHLKDWKNTGNDDFIWIRDQFLNHNHELKHTVIHGHTPCTYLHKKNDIFFGNKKIGIDGACAYGGQLNCLEIKDGEFKQYQVCKIN